MKLEEYFQKVKSSRNEGFRICGKTKKLGMVGYGYRRSSFDEPIRGLVVGSYACNGGGGYFLLRSDSGNIIQVQSFHKNKLVVIK